MPYKDSAKKKENYTKHLEDLKQHAYESITIGEIIDRRKWDMWCNEIKRSVNNKNYAYPDDFTNDIMFEMMILGCFFAVVLLPRSTESILISVTYKIIAWDVVGGVTMQKELPTSLHSSEKHIIVHAKNT